MGYILVAFVLFFIMIVKTERNSVNAEIRHDNKSTLNHLRYIKRSKQLDGAKAARTFMTINQRCSTTGIVGYFGGKCALDHKEIEQVCLQDKPHC